MFTKYIQALVSRLQGLVSPAVIVAISDTFANGAQELDHRGPITLSTYTQQPAIYINNGYADQQSLMVDQGHIILGPSDLQGPSNPNQLIVNNASTYNNYVTHNYPVNFNDDTRHSGDLMPKACVDGLSMGAIARVMLLASIAPGQVVPAQVIDGNGNAVANNASGMLGSGKISVRLSPCLATQGGSGGSSGSAGSAGQCNMYPTGTCAYAAYFSDNAVGGAVADCASRVNIAPFWEIISIFGVGQLEPVTNICCATVNGQQVLVVCKTPFTVCAPVQKGIEDCGGGSCPQ